MSEFDDSGNLYLLDRYEDVEGEIFPTHFDTRFGIWKRISKGTQFTIKEVQIMHNRLGNERIIPDFYAEFKEPFNEGINKLVDVSELFSFDIKYFDKEENKVRNRDVVIAECIKPKEELITEVEIR